MADGLLIPSIAVQVQQFAYFFADLMFLFGLCGIYLIRSDRLELVGLVGFVVSFIGIFMVRSSALSLFGFSAYRVGASVTLLGVVAIGIAMLIRDAFPKLAPLLWIASLIVGVIGLLPFATNWELTFAGVIFGFGFIAAGISLLAQRLR